MHYIGARSSELKPEEDLGTHYFSSSSNTDFIKRQKTFPAEFSYEVLGMFDTKVESLAHETELLKEASKDPKSYNGGMKFIPPLQPVSYTTSKIIQYLGHLIKIARKERRMTETNLAERVGISRATLQKIQNGDGNVSIQSYIETSVVLGIPLLGGDKENVSNMTALLSHMNKFFPETVRGKTFVVDDDF